MKKSMFLFVIAITYAFIFNIAALADDKGMKMDHSQSAGDHGKTMDHSQHVGEKIHESEVEGYQFAYHVLNMQERNTHHMMVYIMSPEGQKVEDAKVGFLVKGPGGNKQKLMTMGMKGAYGADLDLAPKGTYTVKMKAVRGDKKFLDEFIYQVE